MRVASPGTPNTHAHLNGRADKSYQFKQEIGYRVAMCFMTLFGDMFLITIKEAWLFSF